MTAPQSPIADDNDNEAPALLTLGSRNPFLCLDHSTPTDPFNTEGPDYEWNTLVQIDRDILRSEQVEAWELRRADIETRTDWQHRGEQGGHGLLPHHQQRSSLPLRRSQPMETYGKSLCQSQLGAIPLPPWLPTPGLTGMNRGRALNPPRQTRLPCVETGRATPLGGQPVRHSPTTGIPSSPGYRPKDADWEGPPAISRLAPLIPTPLDITWGQQ